MSGAIAITAAVVSVAVAAETLSTFAIIAAVGATVGAVGAITHVKELQYAGAALGAVGLVGGLASGAGLLGGAGDIFGSAAGEGLEAIAGGTTAAETASPFAAAAASGTDAATWAGTAAEGANVLGDAGNWDVINMANGVNVPTGTPDISAATSAPDVTPSSAVSDTVRPPETLTQDQLPAFDNVTPKLDLGAGTGTPNAATDTSVSSLDATPRGLINSGAGNGVEPPNLDGQSGDAVTNAPAGAGQNAPTTQTVPDSAPPPQAVTGKPAGTEADLSGFGSTRGPQGPSDLAARAPDGTLTSSDKSIWSSIYGFVKDHPTLAFGAMQAAGSFLNGSLSPLPEAQVKALAAQAQQNQAAANLYNEQQALLARRLANMSSPIPVATRTPPSMINTGVTGHV